MRILRLVTLLAFASSGMAATVIPVGEFQSVELRNGGLVIVRHGAVQRVSIVKGDPRYTRVRLGAGQRLVIDRFPKEFPRGERLVVEVVTPHLSGAFVSNGGSVQTLGAFPAQSSIEAGVEQGGMVDIRSIPVDAVGASVYSGGRIFTTSRKALTAAVESGGAITYWGEVRDVRRSVRDGGVVTRGAAEDARKPLSEIDPLLPPIPPLPPLPPV